MRGQYLEQSAASISRFFPRAIWDEIQKAPALVEKIKAAHDTNPETRFILSGSSQVLLLRNIRETLAGRAALFANLLAKRFDRFDPTQQLGTVYQIRKGISA